jgi:alkanesulfonate monooxygenase SsuD/methylene tetrahydromethanopterin reductase-like flavin-dependent oxidoreductase (luciferase family)
MTTSEHIANDIAGGSQQHGERQALELADRIRMVAAEDPELAQDLVDQLIAALDRATDGTFRDHLGGATRTAADRTLVGSGNQPVAGISSPTHS